MRARYYEPTSGRFVSEDPDKQGSNWFSYCYNRPTDLLDQNGKAVIAGAILVLLMTALALAAESVGFLAGFELMVNELQSDDPNFNPSFISTAETLGISQIGNFALAMNALTVYGISGATFLSRAGPVAIAAYAIGMEEGAIAACLACIWYEDGSNNS